MKLNKNGWGLKEMLLMMSFLFLFLMLMMYYIYLLYSDLDNREASVYIELENKLAYAARDYVEDGNNETLITLKELKKNGYIVSFTDSNDNPCNGYVIHENGEYISYISCDKFTSDNYDENNEYIY